MKRLTIAVCVLVLVSAVAIIAQTTQTTFAPRGGTVEQELIKLENEWNEAWVNRNIVFFERIYADDFIVTTSDGSVLTRAQDIANVKSGEDMATSVVTDEMKVRIYGDAAVVTHRDTVKGRFKGKDYSGQYQWTDTWVKKSGRWQVVAAHCSKIAAQ